MKEVKQDFNNMSYEDACKKAVWAWDIGDIVWMVCSWNLHIAKVCITARDMKEYHNSLDCYYKIYKYEILESSGKIDVYDFSYLSESDMFESLEEAVLKFKEEYESRREKLIVVGREVSNFIKERE